MKSAEKDPDLFPVSEQSSQCRTLPAEPSSALAYGESSSRMGSNMARFNVANSSTQDSARIHVEDPPNRQRSSHSRSSDLVERRYDR